MGSAGVSAGGEDVAVAGMLGSDLDFSACQVQGDGNHVEQGGVGAPADVDDSGVCGGVCDGDGGADGIVGVGEVATSMTR